MSKYVLHVEGQGQHSPPGMPDDAADADAIAKTAVAALLAAGHSLTIATFSHSPDQPAEVVENLLPNGAPPADQPVPASG
jgi:hypothetical protein